MNPVLLLAALLPAIILLIRVYKLDKIEKEPRPLLVKLVIVGALTGVAASIIEAAATRLLHRYYSGSELGYLLLENFVAVALVEELCEGMHPVVRDSTPQECGCGLPEEEADRCFEDDCEGCECG